MVRDGLSGRQSQELSYIAHAKIATRRPVTSREDQSIFWKQVDDTLLRRLYKYP
jgi:hypothetical protein